MKLFFIPVIFFLSFILENKQSKTSFVYEPITQEKDLQQSIKDGKAIYSDFCMRCHLPQGEGVEGIYPPLAGSDWLSDKRTESIKAVKYGLNGEIEVNGITYNNNMTSMGLTDREVADVMNYILNSFGNEDIDNKQVTFKEVAGLSEE